MNRPARIVAVTEGPAAAADADVLAFAAYVGAVLGAVSGPVAAWLLLRDVPLGRVFITSVAGTVFGGVAGWVSTTAFDQFDQIQYAVLGAVAGCSTAIIALRRRSVPTLKRGPDTTLRLRRS